MLLDEVEKAHPDVHEIFFQVFDKGMMEDGEGRLIDFKNTLILLTSNVGSDLIMKLCKDPELMPGAGGIAKALRAPLLKTFPAALLGRLVVIPYYPLSDDDDRRTSSACSSAASPRASPKRTACRFTYDEEVVKLIAGRCTELESGGRMIDAILTNTMLPAISAAFLDRMLDGETVTSIRVGVMGSDFAYQFE